MTWNKRIHLLTLLDKRPGPSFWPFPIHVRCLGDDLSGDSQPDTLRPLIFVMYWSVRRHASRSTMLPNICSIKAWRSLKYPSLEVREHRYRSLRDDHREGCLTIVTMITTITISSSTQCNQPLATNGVLTKVTLLPRRSGKFIWRLRQRTLFLVDRIIGGGLSSRTPDP